VSAFEAHEQERRRQHGSPQRKTHRVAYKGTRKLREAPVARVIHSWDDQEQRLFLGIRNRQTRLACSTCLQCFSPSTPNAVPRRGRGAGGATSETLGRRVVITYKTHAMRTYKTHAMRTRIIRYRTGWLRSLQHARPAPGDERILQRLLPRTQRACRVVVREHAYLSERWQPAFVDDRDERAAALEGVI